MSDGGLVTILHITDLHFDAQADSTVRNQRNIVLKSMREKLKAAIGSFTPAGQDEAEVWRPSIIAVTGDIAFRASRADYEMAAEFFQDLINDLSVKPWNVIVCPGNHDRNLQRSKGLSYPKDAWTADEWLSESSLRPFVFDGDLKCSSPPLVAPFSDYLKFCRDMEFAVPRGLDGLEYLTGVANVEVEQTRFSFLVLNSAWFSQPGGSDVRNLWLGLPLIEALLQSGQIARTADDVNPESSAHLRVALCHHPREWLHQEEHDSYTSRPNTYRFLAETQDMILHGHVHGALDPPSLTYNSAQTFTGGAAYASGRFRNNFSLLKVDLDDRSVRRRGFEYDPREHRWLEHSPATGTFQLSTRSETAAPMKAGNILGSWKTAFWFSDSNVRKSFQNVNIVESEQYEGQLEGHGESLQLVGSFDEGFLTGRWTEDDRYGAFQLKLLPPGDILFGRWVGFDLNNEIRVGVWRFRRGA